MATDKVQIFISYAREDSAEVMKLYRWLESNGFKPWMDKVDLLGGEQWWTALEKALRQSDFFLLCLSPQSANKRGFIQREINFALDLWQEKLQDDIYIIPVRIEECQVPARVTDFQWVDWFADDGLEKLLKSLRYGLHKLGKALPTTSQPLSSQSVLPRTETTPTAITSTETPTRTGPGGIPLSRFEFETVTTNNFGKIIERRKGEAWQFVEDLGDGVQLEMVEVPGGEFLMGTADSDVEKVIEEAGKVINAVSKRLKKSVGGGGLKQWEENEKKAFTISIKSETPQRRVIVSPFFIGKFTVTQAQWKAVAGRLPRKMYSSQGDLLPVPVNSWNEAILFCEALTQQTGRLYRLPTEAEWEYACRAGTTTPFAFGEAVTSEVVNYDGRHPYGNAPKGKDRDKTKPVGNFPANAFGLFEIHGNIWEWCQDWKGIYDRNQVHDPKGPVKGTERVKRGGFYGVPAIACRSAARGPGSHINSNGETGFRVVVSAGDDHPTKPGVVRKLFGF